MLLCCQLFLPCFQLPFWFPGCADANLWRKKYQKRPHSSLFRKFWPNDDCRNVKNLVWKQFWYIMMYHNPLRKSLKTLQFELDKNRFTYFRFRGFIRFLDKKASNGYIATIPIANIFLRVWVVLFFYPSCKSSIATPPLMTFTEINFNPISKGIWILFLLKFFEPWNIEVNVTWTPNTGMYHIS